MTRRKVKKTVSSLKRLEATPFYPTVADVKRWTEVLGYIMFDGKLPKWGKINVRLMRDFGWCIPYYDGRGHGKCELHIRNKFISFAAFYSVLAHEILHLAEFHELGTVNHGKFFWSHKEQLRRYGIKLKSKY
jgi:hypothetical protein